MGDIYAKAQQVVVWLDPKGESSDKALDQILEFGTAGHLSSIQKYQICVHGH
jgi:hypothetical protein